MRLVNVEIIKNPINWLIVLSMVAVFAFALNLFLGKSAPDNGQSS